MAVIPRFLTALSAKFFNISPFDSYCKYTANMSSVLFFRLQRERKWKLKISEGRDYTNFTLGIMPSEFHTVQHDRMKLFHECTSINWDNHKTENDRDLEAQIASISSRNACNNMDQLRWIKPNYVGPEHCQCISSKKERNGMVTEAEVENGMTKRRNKEAKILRGEIRLAVAERLYSKVTEIMHRCREAAKSSFFFDIGYIFFD